MTAALFALAALATGSPTRTGIPLVSGVDGVGHDLFAESHGRPMALIFINHDCPICNSYAPELERIIVKYSSHVRFELVYAERGMTAATIQKHAKTYDLRGAGLFLDPTGALATYCGASVIPEAAVFDSGGKRTYLGRIDDLYYDFGRQRPAATRHDLRDALDATLSHKPAKPASGPPFGCVIETSSKP